MRRLAMLLAGVTALAVCTAPAIAQNTESTKTHKAKAKTKVTKEPKNEITKLRKARKEDHTVRQVTPDPKKSPGKHADNLSKNINHELNRESKDINHFFQGKKKKK